ncbi:MAG: hypothetical protein M1118_15490, partial [Chloroflexi bacterium]|nr:hypothetical protein [Chloroflexota bacterium]
MQCRLSRRSFLQTSTMVLGLTGTALLSACGAVAPAAGATTSSSKAAATTTSASSTSAASSTTASSTAAAPSTAATSTVATATPAPAGAAPAAGKTAVDFWEWGGGSYQAGFTKWAGAFNAKSSDVQVTVTVPGGNYYQKVTVAEAGGTGPDAFLSDSDGFKNRAFAGLEGSIADLVAQDKTVGENLKQMLPAAVQWYQYDGKQWGLPWDYSVGVVLYNVNQLDAAGLTPPTELSKDPAKWTWNILAQYAEKLTVMKGNTVDRVGALVSWSGYENSWYSLALANGGHYFNTSLDQCTLASPEAVAALDFVAGLAKRGVIATPTSWKAITSQYKKPMEPFTAGKVAMQYTG